MKQLLKVWGLNRRISLYSQETERDASLVLVLVIQGRPDSVTFPLTKCY